MKRNKWREHQRNINTKTNNKIKIQESIKKANTGRAGWPEKSITWKSNDVQEKAAQLAVDTATKRRRNAESQPVKTWNKPMAGLAGS